MVPQWFQQAKGDERSSAYQRKTQDCQKRQDAWLRESGCRHERHPIGEFPDFKASPRRCFEKAGKFALARPQDWRRIRKAFPRHRVWDAQAQLDDHKKWRLQRGIVWYAPNLHEYLWRRNKKYDEHLHPDDYRPALQSRKFGKRYGEIRCFSCIAPGGFKICERHHSGFDQTNFPHWQLAWNDWH